MDFELTEDQRAFQDTARAFARDHLLPYAAQWDEGRIFPAEALRAAAALGFAGIYVPEEHGGSGLSRLDAAIIFEELAAADPSTTAFLTIHNMVAGMIARHGNDDQRARLLADILSGARFVSYCLTEPGAGSDAASLSTRATPSGNAAYSVTGGKAFISGGGVADLYVTMVRTADGGARGVTCLMVEKGTPGLSFGKPENKMGWNSQPTTQVLFDNCLVPITNRLGAEGEGFRFAMGGLDVDGGTVDQQRRARHAGDDAALAGVDLRHMPPGRQHGDDHLGPRHGGRDRRAGLPARLHQGRAGAVLQVEAHDVMAGLHQVQRHGQAHVAQADKCDLHAASSNFRAMMTRMISLVPSRMRWTRRSRR